MMRFLASSDRVQLCSITKCLAGFNEAMGQGKGLATILNDISLFPSVLSVIGKLRSATSVSEAFRFFIFSDFRPSDIDFPSAFLQFCDLVDIDAICSIRNSMAFSMSSLPVSTFDAKTAAKTTFWKRLLLLLGFFDSSANFMTQTLFQNVKFNEENLSLMIRYLRDIDNPVFQDVGYFFVSSLYCVEQARMKVNLLRIWGILFTPANLEEAPLHLFDRYDFPQYWSPTDIGSLLSRFPMLDQSNAYGFPPNTEQHYQEFSVRQWKDRRFGRLNFTSIELQPVPLDSVAWYFKLEAQEVNLRFLHSQHRFDRSLRVLLGILRAKKPSINLSVMFHPRGFFALLKHDFSLQKNCRSDKIGFLLTREPTEFPIENLIAINTACEDDGKFAYLSGSRMLKQMYMKTVEIEPEMTEIRVYRSGTDIGSFRVYRKDVLPVDSVFLLTAFTTPLA
jgi:hypothetical protein